MLIVAQDGSKVTHKVDFRIKEVGSQWIIENMQGDRFGTFSTYSKAKIALQDVILAVHQGRYKDIYYILPEESYR